MRDIQYLVLFRGDDSNTIGTQNIILEIQTDVDLTGCKAHFDFLDFHQVFDEIPADKKLALVFSKEDTKKFPCGAFDGVLWIEDQNHKRRTLNNRIHIVVTNSVNEAYDSDDQQSITVNMTGGGCSWNNISGKPSEFPPEAHRHEWSDIDSAPTASGSGFGLVKVGGGIKVDGGVISVNAPNINDIKNFDTSDMTQGDKTELLKLIVAYIKAKEA